MDSFLLNPGDLQVQSFPTTSSDPAVGTMKTYEPGCTTPDLCPNGTVAVAPMKTYEPGCTTPDLCPIGGTVAVA
ncbi:hypothetical protein [Longimicrobium sp.]|uniref:hypothetical protein n=1 Tax=Longimicrobium sp. TaxID=2029185 RepID=UPI002D001C5E|nr:hypothetical protein [Longimicrobium sp.]HSU15926.1 hypothetical protein [Longimicrobium sp.]